MHQVSTAIDPGPVARIYSQQEKGASREMNLGFTEIVVIFVVALLIFGPRKLPDLGRSLGKGLNEFKRASNELKRTWEEEVKAEEEEVRKTFQSAEKEVRKTLDSA